METHTLGQIMDDMKAAAKAGKWLSCTYRISTDKGVFSVGVKAFGKWVQRIEMCGLVDSIPEQKTWKALSSEFARAVYGLSRCI